METVNACQIADLLRPLPDGVVLDRKRRLSRLATARRWLSGRGLRPVGAEKTGFEGRPVQVWDLAEVRREMASKPPVSGLGALSPARRSEAARKGHATRRARKADTKGGGELA